MENPIGIETYPGVVIGLELVGRNSMENPIGIETVPVYIALKNIYIVATQWKTR